MLHLHDAAVVLHILIMLSTTQVGAAVAFEMMVAYVYPALGFHEERPTEDPTYDASPHIHLLKARASQADTPALKVTTSVARSYTHVRLVWNLFLNPRGTGSGNVGTELEAGVVGSKAFHLRYCRGLNNCQHYGSIFLSV